MHQLSGDCCHSRVRICVISCIQAYQAAKSRMEELEDQEIQLFSDAKRKMTKLRKEREQEIFM